MQKLITIIILAAFLNPIQAQMGPKIIKAQIQPNQNVLMLSFDRDINHAGTAMYNSIAFYTDGGGDTVEISKPWMDQKAQSPGSRAVIQFDPLSSGKLQNWLKNGNQVRMNVQESTFFAQLDGLGNLRLEYIPVDIDSISFSGGTGYPIGTHLTWAGIEFDAGFLVLEFNEPVRDDFRSDSGVINLYLQDNLLENTISIYTPFSEDMGGIPNDHLIKIMLTPAQSMLLQPFKDRPYDIAMDISPGLFISVSDVPNIPIIGYHLQSPGIPWTSDELYLTRANLDTVRAILILEFNQMVKEDLMNQYGTITLSSRNNPSLILRTPLIENSPVKNDKEIWINIGAQQEQELKDFAGRNVIYSLAMERSIFNTGNNIGNREETAFDLYPVDSFMTTLNVIWAAYNHIEHFLLLNFNRDIDDPFTRRDAKIRLFSQDLANSLLLDPDWGEASPFANDREVIIKIGYQQALIIESWNQSAGGNLFVTIEQGAFKILLGDMRNPAIEKFHVEIGDKRPYSENFELMETAYNPAENIVSLRFSKPLDDNLTELSSGQITLWSLVNSSFRMRIQNPLEEVSGGNDNIAHFRLDLAQAALLENEPGREASIMLSAGYGLFTDKEGTRSQEIYGMRLNWGYKIEANSNPAIFAVGAEYLAEKNILRLKFNQNLDDSKTDKMGLILLSVDNGGPNTITLNTPWNDVSAGLNDGEIIINMDDLQASNLESQMYPGAPFKISMAADIFRTSGDNLGNKILTFRDNIFVHYVPENNDSSPLGNAVIITEDHNGYTNDPILKIKFEVPEAEMMIVSLGDTLSGGWIPYTNEFKLNISGGGDGKKHLFFKFRNRTETSRWFLDTTFYDATAPQHNFIPAEKYSAARWLGVISGELTDQASGPAMVMLTFIRSSDNMYYDGQNWVTGPDTGFIETQGLWDIKIPAKDLGTGEYRLSLSGVDRAGNISEWKSYIMDINDDITIEARLAGGAAKFKIIYQGLKSMDSFIYNLRKVETGAEKKYLPSRIINTEIYYYPLPDGEYIFEARTNTQVTFSRYKFNISGVLSKTLEAGKWLMTGVLGQTVPAVDLGENAFIAQWKDNGIEDKIYSKYAVSPDISELSRGNGYWILLENPIIIKTPEDQLLKDAFELNLVREHLGWNQISNPFPYPVDVSNSGLVFWEWDPASADMKNSGGILKSGTAYWTEVSANRKLQISPLPYFKDSTSGLAKQFDHKIIDRDNWSMQMIIEAGSYTDSYNYLGISPGLGKASAQNVLSEPPKMGKFITLSFSSPSSQTLKTVDYRTQFQSKIEWWDFVIKNKHTGENTAKLTLSGLNDLIENGFFVYLVKNGEFTQLSDEVFAKLSITRETNYYSLAVTSDPEDIDKIKGTFKLQSNFPNPVRTYTFIPFSLPERWNSNGRRINNHYNVSLQIHTLSGRKVAEIQAGDYAAGSHILKADFSLLLDKIHPGAYLYTLKADDYRQSRKLLFVK